MFELIDSLTNSDLSQFHFLRPARCWLCYRPCC